MVRADGQWRFKRRELRAAGTQDFHVKQQIPLGRAVVRTAFEVRRLSHHPDRAQRRRSPGSCSIGRTRPTRCRTSCSTSSPPRSRELRDTGGPVIGIRGEGRGFSAGYDLDQVGKAGAADPVADRARLQRNLDRYLAIWDHPKPVIAAVHGYCIAGATQMCVFADITVVADDAKIGEPALPIGGGYIAPLWAPLVGPKRAKELAFVPGNSIDGRTAVEWGWANHSVAVGPADPGRRGSRRSDREDAAGRPADQEAVDQPGDGGHGRAPRHRLRGRDGRAPAHLTRRRCELREWIGEVGMKEAIAAYRVPPTTPLSGLSRSRKEAERCPDVEFSQDGHVARVRLNRPEVAERGHAGDGQRAVRRLDRDQRRPRHLGRDSLGRRRPGVLRRSRRERRNQRCTARAWPSAAASPASAVRS